MRQLRVTTRGSRTVTEAGLVQWTGPVRAYEGALANFSAEGLTLRTEDDVNHILRIPATVVLKVEDLVVG